jgi:hypothetical protein
VDSDTLKGAVKATAQKRDTIAVMGRYAEILSIVENNEIMKKYWTDYQAQFDYANDIKFEGNRWCQVSYIRTY